MDITIEDKKQKAIELMQKLDIYKRKFQKMIQTRKFIIWSGIDMKEYKTMAHINSLNGELDEITVLEKIGDNDYVVDYKGVKCHALFNWFVCEYYADDIYGIIKE